MHELAVTKHMTWQNIAYVNFMDEKLFNFVDNDTKFVVKLDEGLDFLIHRFYLLF